MKKVIKLSFKGGVVYTGYLAVKSFHNNIIKQTPQDPELHKKENKRIVVVGAGIVGLATAYYLSQYKDNKVYLIEKAEKPAQECSI